MCYEIKLHISINMLKHSFVIPLTYTTYLIVSNESSEHEAISVDMLLADVDPRSLIGFKWTNACLLNLATYWSNCLSWNIAHLNFKLQMVFWTYEMLIIFTISLFILCDNNHPWRSASMDSPYYLYRPSTKFPKYWSYVTTTVGPICCLIWPSKRLVGYNIQTAWIMHVISMSYFKILIIAR